MRFSSITANRGRRIYYFKRVVSMRVSHTKLLYRLKRFVKYFTIYGDGLPAKKKRMRFLYYNRLMVIEHA